MEGGAGAGFCEFAVEGPGRLQRAFGVNGYPGLKARVEFVDAMQEGFDQSLGGEAASCYLG